MAKSSKQTRPLPRKEAKGLGDDLNRARAFNWRDRQDLIALGIVLVAAFVVRMWFFYMNQKNNPVFNLPIMDALYHDEWARDILKGGARGDDVFFRGPLYPYLLAFLYKISGSSLVFAVFVQHLMGVATAGLTYLLAREYFSPRVSLVAGLFGALYWTFIYFEGDLLIVTTILFLNTLSFLLFAKAMRRHDLRLFAAAGVVLGLSIIARPSVLIFVPAIPAFIYWTTPRQKQTSPGWIKRSAFVAVAAGVMVLPVMVRNFVVARAIVPVAASGGVNFFIGNNPLSDGSTAIVPGTRADWWGGYEDAIAIAERDMGRKLGLSEVSNYYFKRGLSFIGSRPELAWPLMVKKARMFWAGPERANNKFIYFFWHLAGMKYVPLPGFWMIAPLGLLGTLLLWRRRAELSMFYLFVVTYSIGVIAFFVNARFRLPIMPVMIIFAAYASLYLFEAFRQKSYMLVRALVALVVAAALVNSDYMWVKQIRAYSDAFSHNTLGNAYLKLNRGDAALTHFMLAEQINKEYPTQAYELISRDVNYNMGVLLWEQGLCSRAIEALEKVSGSDEFTLTALDYLGDCYLKKNNVSQAALAYRRFIAISKDDPRGITGLARCQSVAGNYAEAERMLLQIVDPNAPVYPPAYMALALAQRGLGKTEEAIESYRNISKMTGYEKDALLALAEIYTEQHNYDAAIETLLTAQNYMPSNDQTIPQMIRQLRARN